MTAWRRVVLDTNAVIGRLLIPKSVPAQAIRLAMANDLVLVSEDTMMELACMLSQRKYDNHVSINKRKDFFACSEAFSNK